MAGDAPPQPTLAQLTWGKEGKSETAKREGITAKLTKKQLASN